MFPEQVWAVSWCEDVKAVFTSEEKAFAYLRLPIRPHFYGLEIAGWSLDIIDVDPGGFRDAVHGTVPDENASGEVG